MTCESKKRKLVSLFETLLTIAGIILFSLLVSFAYYSHEMENLKEEHKKEMSLIEIRETREGVVKLQKELAEIREKLLESQKKTE